MSDDHDEDITEDELADAVGSPGRRMSPALMVFGLGLFACAALPLTPSGTSFLGLLLAAFGRSPLEGLMMALGFGAPFWYGLVVAIGAWPKGPLGTHALRQILISNASLLHGQLALVAWLLWRDGLGVLPSALLGFAVVSGGFFIVQHASASAAEGGVDEQGRRHEGMDPRWLIRWTATVLVGVCGWLRLQLLGGLAFGWAVEAALACSVAIAVVLTRRR
ncbi:hypothetical protein ACNOYE_06200 [Nannocystaceae bacterium ST9]